MMFNEISLACCISEKYTTASHYLCRSTTSTIEELYSCQVREIKKKIDQLRIITWNLSCYNVIRITLKHGTYQVKTCVFVVMWCSLYPWSPSATLQLISEKRGSHQQVGLILHSVQSHALKKKQKKKCHSVGTVMIKSSAVFNNSRISPCLSPNMKQNLIKLRQRVGFQ